MSDPKDTKHTNQGKDVKKQEERVVNPMSAIPAGFVASSGPVNTPKQNLIKKLFGF